MTLNTLLRSLPDFKGKQRIARLLFGKALKQKKDIVVKGDYGIQYKLPNCVESIGFEIFVNGVYEKETSDLIISHLPKNGVFADIGANIGSISLLVSKKRPDVTSLCVEASPRIYDYLKFNFEINGLSNSILINKALADKDGDILTFTRDAQQFGKGYIGDANSSATEKVETIKLDTLLLQAGIKTPDVIKVDIEGYEYYGFKGAENLLTSAGAPSIVFEFDSWAEKRTPGLKPGMAQQLLLDYGYALYTIEADNKKKQIQTPITTGFTMLWAEK
jgi:FkbM family methyltransferase